MPVIEEKNETEDEEMEQETPDSENTEDDDSDTASGSDGEDSTDIDEEECDNRRTECLEDMADLERQFTELREELCQERLCQVDAKLEEVKAECALEYINPLAQLQENMRIRTQVAGILRELKCQNIRNKYEAEDQAADQNFQSEKMLLYDQVTQDLQDKIRRLEEDRHNIDITSDLWNESQTQKKKKRSTLRNTDRRRKPVTVSGPYIIYLLKESDIIDDWTAIKKALKQTEKQDTKKKRDIKLQRLSVTARYEDGKLFYENQWYSKGHHIIIDNKKDSPVHATITAINTGEVWVKRSDGNKSKLYIVQLQKRKYTIRHVPY